MLRSNIHCYALGALIMFVTGCQHKQIKLRKAALLDVTMDPAKSGSPASALTWLFLVLRER